MDFDEMKNEEQIGGVTVNKMNLRVRVKRSNSNQSPGVGVSNRSPEPESKKKKQKSKSVGKSKNMKNMTVNHSTRSRSIKSKSESQISAPNSNDLITKLKKLLCEFCDSNCQICHELIHKLSQHVKEIPESDLDPESSNCDDLDLQQQDFDFDPLNIQDDENVSMKIECDEDDIVRVPSGDDVKLTPEHEPPRGKRSHDHDIDSTFQTPMPKKLSRVKGRRRLRCNLCAQTFSYQETLDQHLKSHPTYKPPILDKDEEKKRIQAEIMAKAFDLAGISKVKVNQLTPTLELPQIKGKTISCNICSAVFFSTEKLEKHYKDFHDPTKVNYPCPECGVQFRSSKKLSQHFAQAHPTSTLSYDCTICSSGGKNKKFKNMCNLKNHVATAHAPQGHVRMLKFKCTFDPAKCNAAFLHQCLLDIHMRSYHTDERPFACEVKGCGKKFRKKQGLKYHVTSYHEKISKKFMCEICSQFFVSAATLRRHAVTHTGERAYICDQCGKAFGQKSVLATHYKQHTGERPHICDKCGKGYILPAGLRLHMKSQHGHGEK